MARVVLQQRVIKVITPEIVQYRCDRCGEICGTKANRKQTWCGSGKSKHYCEKTCSPGDHPRWDITHVLACESCLKGNNDPRIAEAVLDALGGEKE